MRMRMGNSRKVARRAGNSGTARSARRCSCHAVRKQQSGGNAARLLAPVLLPVAIVRGMGDHTCLVGWSRVELSTGKT